MIDLEKLSEIHSPGYVIEIYNKGEENEIVYGSRETKPTIKPCTKDTLFDIASLTKTYTATLVYIAYEEKKVNLSDTIFAVDNHFTNLKDVTILDLLSHNQEIWTNGYLGSAKTKEEFYTILYSANVKTNSCYERRFLLKRKENEYWINEKIREQQELDYIISLERKIQMKNTTNLSKDL